MNSDDPHDDPEESGHGPDDPEPGYLWTDGQQRTGLPAEEYDLHRAILDEMEEDELRALDLERANDYVLWAAAQALDESDQTGTAIDLLERIVASGARHPALDYPAIGLRLVDRLKERGLYDRALVELDRVERADRDLADACREQRAEILVLTGRRAEGARLFEKAARRAPGDPWVPLQAAWAFLQRGEFDDARDWTERADRARRDVEDEQEAREAAAGIDRLRAEIAERSRRRAAPAPGPGAAPAAERDRILADLDREETRLVQAPPRDAAALEAATSRLADLHARASAAWDDAVEAGDEPLIAAFDDLQWEIVGLAQRFGVSIPGTEDD